MSVAGTSRRLSAILVADLVGYTRLMHADGDAAFKLVKDFRSRVIEPAIEKCEGRIFKLAGDGVLAEFASARAAVEAALSIQENTEEEDIAWRIGVALGDVLVDDDGDVYGDGVNIASRVEGLAAPGSICITHMVFETLPGSLRRSFVDGGMHTVKGIGEAMHVWQSGGIAAAQTEGSVVQLRLLGGFGLDVHGEAQPLTSAKARLLLARIALSDTWSVPRESLAALLWEDVPQDQARANLRQCLVQARQALGPAAEVLTADAERVSLDPAQVASDVQDLLAAMHGTATESQTDGAGRLLLGDLLEGVPARGREISDWLAVERERIRTQQLQLLDGAAEEAFQAQDLDGAARAALRALALDPLRETAHRRMMRIYTARGDYARAIRQFEICREQLKRELDVTPEAATTALYREIREKRAAPPAAERQARKEPLESPESLEPPAEREANDLAETELREVAVLCALAPGEDDPESQMGADDPFAEVVQRIRAQCAPAEIPSDEVDLLLVFGLDHAHEDDAAHALSAGRAILDEVAGARVGVAAGRVLAEPGSKRRISGEVRRRATRLAAAAEAGELAADPALHPILAGLGENGGDDGGTMPLHGTSRPRPPFVGRAMERRQIAALLEAASEDEAGAVVLVAGDAGMGKTRLAQESAEAFTARGGRVVRTGFSGFGEQAETFAQRFARLLRDSAGADLPGDSPPTAAVRGWLLGTPPLPGEGALLAAMDQDRLTGLTATVLAGLLAAGPKVGKAAGTLAMIEDTHWADPADLELLVRLASLIGQERIVLIATERPSEARLAPLLRRSTMDTEVLMLELTPLPARDARRLAEALGRQDEGFVSDAIARAGGNALFLVRLLEAGPELAGAPPPSVVSLVQTQTSGLPDALRRILRRAAVLGQRFNPADYAAVFGGAGFAPLVERGFLIPEAGQMTFTHALFHEAVYTSVTRADRKRLHGRAAAHFRGRDAVRWADHALLAGEPDAARACAEAASVLLPRYDFARGERYIAAGLEAPGSEGDTRALLLHSRGSLRRERGDLDGAIADFEAATASAASSASRIQSLARECWVYRLRGNLDEADACLERADAQDTAGVDPDTLSEIWVQRGNQAFARGQVEDCERFHAKAAELAEEPQCRSRALGGLGDAHYAAGRMRSARRNFSDCVALAREHGLGVVEMANAYMEAFSQYFEEPGPQAFALIEMALERASQAGNARSELIGRTALAEMLLWDNRPDECNREIAAVADLQERLGGTRFDTEVGFIRALSALRHGARAQARTEAQQAIGQLSEGDRGHIGAALYGVFAVASDDQADVTNALDSGEDILRQGSISHAHFWFRQLATEALIRHRRFDEALAQAEALERFTAREPLGWTDHAIGQARLLVRLASGENRAEDEDEAAKMAEIFDSDCLSVLSADLRQHLKN